MSWGSEMFESVVADCRKYLPTLKARSVHAVVTDPPYGLEFMGKDWDTFSIQHRGELRGTPEHSAHKHGRGFANGVRLGNGLENSKGFEEFCRQWASELHRVLRPGGYMLCFGGTRTYHRLACAVEDAGFEIRDSIAFYQSKPFDLVCDCEKRSSVVVDSDVCGLPKSLPEADVLAEENQGADVFLPVQREASRGGVGKARVKGQGRVDGNKSEILSGKDDGTKESGVEGRSNVPPTKGKLRQRPVCPVPESLSTDGTGGRVCDGTSTGNGPDSRAMPGTKGMRTPSRSRPAKQRTGESGTVAGQSLTQTRGGGTICDRCGKPTVMPWGWPDGLFAPYLAWQYGSGFPKGDSCLKPAWEPILLARKPGPKMIPFGIDDCRVPTNGETITGRLDCDGKHEGWDRPWMRDKEYVKKKLQDAYDRANTMGRWPANVVHDGSDEVLEAFAEFGSKGGGFGVRGVGGTVYAGGRGYTTDFKETGQVVGHGDTGTASRFFYSAKASKLERMASANGTTHPTQKPLAMCRWLVRLISRPGETVLDPFQGSGTVGVASILEGRDYLGCDDNPEYSEISRRRLEKAVDSRQSLMAGPVEKVSSVPLPPKPVSFRS